MTDFAPRCPFCANVLKFQPTLWERIGLRATKAHCPSCYRVCEERDAHTMGTAFGHWAERFRKELTHALNDLPILSEPAAFRAMGMPRKDDTRLMPSVEELIRTCMKFQREILIEMARGREATLEVVQLDNASSHSIEAVAILGTSSAESGAKDCEQIVARHGTAQYVLCIHPVKDGTESRVKRAVQQKVNSGRPGTDAPIPAAPPTHLAAQASHNHVNSKTHAPPAAQITQPHPV